MSTLYPLFLSLRGRACVVVGGNEMAETKIRELLDADAKIHVIAPAATDQISAWSQAERLEWVGRAYESGDLREAFLLVSVADAKTNAQVFHEAETRRTLCNAVDDIEHCNCL
jgi:siroheme synthase-like protein